MFGQSYQLFGQNSFAVGGPTNTGIGSGLDTTRSDYVARASYQPNSTFMFTSRFRFDQSDFRDAAHGARDHRQFRPLERHGDVRRLCRPAGARLLDRREGILANGRLKLNQNWVLLGGARYDLRAEKVSQTQCRARLYRRLPHLGLELYDILYSYSGSTAANNTVFLQLALRTLGGTTVGHGDLRVQQRSGLTQQGGR